jgi:outer membrane protein, heavy metal efflux system
VSHFLSLRDLRRLVLRLLALSLIAFGIIPRAFADLSFDAALKLADERAPDLTARRHALDSAERAQPAADSLPDPRLVLGVDNVPIEGADAWKLDRDSMTMRRIGLMQEVPNGAKRRARADRARAITERERTMLEAERAMMRREVALAWLNRHYLERRLALLDELERENELLIKTAQAQLSSGQGMPTDAISARQEAAMLADRRDELNRDLVRAKATLRRWLGEVGNEPLSDTPPSFAIDPSRVREQWKRHPALAVYGPMIDEAAAEVREAEAMKRPDWGVELAYQQRGADFGDMAMVQISIDLPLFRSSRQNPRIAAKMAEASRVHAEREAAERKYREDLEGVLADYETAMQKLNRARDTLLPLADEKVNLMLASYRAGKTSLTQTLSARRELIEMRLQLIALESEANAIASQLVYLYPEISQ